MIMIILIFKINELNSINKTLLNLCMETIGAAGVKY